MVCHNAYVPIAIKTTIAIKGEQNQEIEIDEDDYFKNSIEKFVKSIKENKEKDVYQQILLQDYLMEEVRKNNEEQ